MTLRRLRSVVGAVLAGTALATAGAAVPATAAAHKQNEPDYQPTYESLSRHRSPQWFDDAKLGIFVHWGAYAVPAYAPVGEYAEWYWSKLSESGKPVQAHHLAKYGKDVVYDDFLKQWRAERWNPDEWLKLFKDGGAKYFTLTSKHHDGVALWDTATTDRSTAKLGPRRDFVKELLEADDRGGYGLKKGLYYSMPEWYNPAMPRIGGGWFGRGAPKNFFTGEPVPYTGYKPITDYVKDHQYPQLKELVNRFDPDLIWCDIGLEDVNNSLQLNAQYFNQAKNRANPKEVAVNNRCGSNVPHDFTTPEYSVEPDIKKEKWEASRGIGHSYGYNAEETDADHLTADQLVDSFADIVSKNGNLLLNVGPKADGTVPAIQAQRVRELGQWVDLNREAVYGSRYWTQAEDKGANVPVRFSTQPKAFYATALQWPGERLTLTAPVPVKTGDEVRLIGYDRPLKWTRDGQGRLVVEMPAQGQSATPGKHAFVFRVAAPGYDARRATLLGLDARATAAAAGEQSTVTVDVANRGDRKAAGGDLTIRTPYGTRTVYRPAMEPHTRTTITATVTVPAGTGSGDRPVEVTALAGTESFEARASLHVVGQMTKVDLAAAYDSDGIGTADARTDGDFDGVGSTYVAEQLPRPGDLTVGRVPFTFPSGANGVKNNVRAGGQSVVLKPGRYGSLHLLTSAGYGPARSKVTVTYADGSTEETELAMPDWMTGSDPVAAQTTDRYRPAGREPAQTKIFQQTVRLDAGKEVRSVTFGRPGPAANVTGHVWAMTLEG
ncbi:alpha-L-fucosidase [Actinomadura hibisca]|uniref:alpha-L-fucosidase n=1 Tax=Actinomadura hibisca TaxID=68565 RepID=UPI000AF7EED0|nr:alpha-L-fucosidase [Actinomadura hibisca]